MVSWHPLLASTQQVASFEGMFCPANVSLPVVWPNTSDATATVTTTAITATATAIATAGRTPWKGVRATPAPPDTTATATGGFVNMSGCATPLQQQVVQWVSPCLVLGLACSLYSFVFCCGQILHTISEEGYYPKCLQGCKQRQRQPRRPLQSVDLSLIHI